MEYKSTFVLFTVMSIALLAATIVVSYGSQQVQAIKGKPLWCLTTIGDGTACVADRTVCVANYKQNPIIYEGKCFPRKG